MSISIEEFARRQPFNKSISLRGGPRAPQSSTDLRKHSTILQSYVANPKAAVQAHRPKISITRNEEGVRELSVNRSNTPLKRQICQNNSAFSELSTNSSTSGRSVAPPPPSRSSQYKQAYGSLRQMFFKQPKMDGTLRNCQVTPPFRTKMVNWMVEVFQKFSDKSSDRTFFRAVLIMDLFLKHYRARVLDNSDVYLIGLTCIFLASKYTDVEHITLEEFAHYKVSKDLPVAKIREFEYVILTTLGFEIYFPVVLDFLDHHYDTLLEGYSPEYSEKVRFFCLLVAKLCVMNVDFNDINFEVLSMAILLFVVRCVDCSSSAGAQSFHHSQSRISVASLEIQRKISQNLGPKLALVETVMLLVKDYVEGFRTYNPQFDNVWRYHCKYELRTFSR